MRLLLIGVWTMASDFNHHCIDTHLDNPSGLGTGTTMLVTKHPRDNFLSPIYLSEETKEPGGSTSDLVPVRWWDVWLLHEQCDNIVEALLSLSSMEPGRTSQTSSLSDTISDWWEKRGVSWKVFFGVSPLWFLAEGSYCYMFNASHMLIKCDNIFVLVVFNIVIINITCSGGACDRANNIAESIPPPRFRSMRSASCNAHKISFAESMQRLKPPFHPLLTRQM